MTTFVLVTKTNARISEYTDFEDRIIILNYSVYRIFVYSFYLICCQANAGADGVAGDGVPPQSVTISDGELRFEQEATQAENEIKVHCRQSLLPLIGTDIIYEKFHHKPVTIIQSITVYINNL